jgi:hypothetical protein
VLISGWLAVVASADWYMRYHERLALFEECWCTLRRFVVVEDMAMSETTKFDPNCGICQPDNS